MLSTSLMCSSAPALKRDPLKALENQKPDLGAVLITSKKQPLKNCMFNLYCQQCKIKNNRRNIDNMFYTRVNPPDFLEELEWGIPKTLEWGIPKQSEEKSLPKNPSRDRVFGGKIVRFFSVRDSSDVFW